ncbi:MAG: phosphoribosylamine--glycine ligase [Planctomycetota bacterium]
MATETESVNVLILGSGGREHALGWKLKQSPRCGELFFAPGNGGTAALGTNVDLPFDPVNTKNADAIDYFARQHNVRLIVIGPEDPLCGGLADRLQAYDPSRHIFGPAAAAAKLEGDKAFSKDLMRAAQIPTADSKTFTNRDAALAYAETRELPVVVKAAGLAKGKGVVVTDTAEEAVDAVKLIMGEGAAGGAYGQAGATVVIEERLVGQEVSVLAMVDGESIFVLDPTQDHKQAHEGDTGPNTGGMGAYCPTPLLDEETREMIEREVLVRTVDALRRNGVTFQGILYAGLMLTAGGPKVLEFNTRFGDPECQPLMLRLQGDLLEAMVATCEGRLDNFASGGDGLSWDERVCCCVVMCSGGYPGDYRKGLPITGIADAEIDSDVTVFHAGTKLDKSGTLVTDGGRVLNVCALGATLQEAQAKANAACEKINFEDSFFRRDIGSRVI